MVGPSSARGLDEAALVEKTTIGKITPELLQQREAWEEAEFRRFDVTLPSATPRMGRTHPMQALIERIRTIFLEMGFSELVDDYVQTAGWNMDALFIPQDHPAREMQDTFYLDAPASLPTIDTQWTNGAPFTSTVGDRKPRLGRHFSDDIAQRGLLRTHTTVNTIQHLPNTRRRPAASFRWTACSKEAIDRTHLPNSTKSRASSWKRARPADARHHLAHLLRQDGLPRSARPTGLLPVHRTQPRSRGPVAGKWLELGGAGIFRPEVTEPLGCMAPVCAWGMGLERLAMLVLGLDDIRQLYISDLAWLRDQPML